MKIAITTLMREDRQKAIAQIPESLHKHVILFTRADRFNLLLKEVPKTIEVYPSPLEIDNIAWQRQYVMDHVHKIGHKKMWMIDDLTRFQIREPGTTKLRKPTDDEYINLYNRISKDLDTYAQVGISPRHTNFGVSETTKEIGRCYTTYGLNIDMCREVGASFDGLFRKTGATLFEDYYITLKLLTSGKKNLIRYDYAFEHTHNTAGGNSGFRNLETQKQAAEALQREFPGLVKLKVKEEAWGNSGVDMAGRTEPSISWRDAYESSKSDSLF